MDPNRMTEKSRDALQQAQTLATRHHRQQVDNEHLLLALLEQEDGAVARILQRAGGDLDVVSDGLVFKATVATAAGA